SRAAMPRRHAAAAVRHQGEYFIPIEHHNPMELFAATVIWNGDGKLTVFDKTQGVQNVQRYVCGVFGLNPDNVRVLSPFVGGAFGSGLRPQYEVVLAVQSAFQLQRSTQLVLTRAQMYGLGYRPALWTPCGAVASIASSTLRVCVLGCADPIPTARLVARYEFGHGRDFRQRRGARRGGDCRGAQFARPDVLNRMSYWSKQDLHLSAEQIGHEIAAVRGVKQVDTGHHHEQLAENMGRAPDAGRRHVQLARIGLGISDEFGNRLGRDQRVHHHGIRGVDDTCDRRDVADEVEIEVGVKCRVDGIRRQHKEQRVAVRQRSYDDFGANITAGARPVFDDELLSEPL